GTGRPAHSLGLRRDGRPGVQTHGFSRLERPLAARAFAEASLDVEPEAEVAGLERGAVEGRGDVLVRRHPVAVRQKDLEEVSAEGTLDPDRPTDVGFDRVREIAVRGDD